MLYTPCLWGHINTLLYCSCLYGTAPLPYHLPLTSACALHTTLLSLLLALSCQRSILGILGYSHWRPSKNLCKGREEGIHLKLLFYGGGCPPATASASP